jgi:hypothetical protein
MTTNTMIPKPPVPSWKGPYKAGPQSGVTQSLLQRFAECPFKFYLYAYCGLRDPKPPHENLPWGSTIHKGLEVLIKGASLADAFQAMFDYHTQHYPERDLVEAYTAMEMLKLIDITPYRSWPDPVDAEVPISEEITIPPHSCSLPQRIIWGRGLMDVSAPNHLGDHKAKGNIYPEDTSRELGEDLQMNFYSYITEKEHWHYDLIKCPLSAWACPERRPGYSPEAFANSIFHKHTNNKYYFPIARHVPFWVNQVTFFQPRTTCERYFKQVIGPWCNRLCDWWEYVNHPSFDPNETTHYNTIFYKMPVRLFSAAKTDKFKGDYYDSIIEHDYSNLVPVKSYFSELEE